MQLPDDCSTVLSSTVLYRFVLSGGRQVPVLGLKKTMCLWSNCFSKIDAVMHFFYFLLVRFLNRGKRSEMVSVVSRYERNEI